MERVVQAIRNGTAESKWKRHPSGRDTQGHAPIAHEKANIRLKSHEEQKQDQPQIGNYIETGNAFRRKDRIGKTRNATHDRGAQDNPAHDLCNHTRLADLGQRPVDETAEHDDNNSLENHCQPFPCKSVLICHTWMIKRTIGFFES